MKKILLFITYTLLLSCSHTPNIIGNTAFGETTPLQSQNLWDRCRSYVRLSECYSVYDEYIQLCMAGIVDEFYDLKSYSERQKLMLYYGCPSIIVLEEQ